MPINPFRRASSRGPSRYPLAAGHTLCPTRTRCISRTLPPNRMRSSMVPAYRTPGHCGGRVVRWACLHPRGGGLGQVHDRIEGQAHVAVREQGVAVPPGVSPALLCRKGGHGVEGQSAPFGRGHKSGRALTAGQPVGHVDLRRTVGRQGQPRREDQEVQEGDMVCPAGHHLARAALGSCWYSA